MESGWLSALAGGVAIGIAASSLLFFSGRVFGVSGIVGEALTPRAGDAAWRYAAIFGMLAGGATLTLLYPGAFDPVAVRPLPVTAIAGLLVGFGTRLGGGCTSGHGICGVSRLSTRSILATVTFIAAGILTTTLFGLRG